jgi:hypothetical protein
MSTVNIEAEPGLQQWLAPVANCNTRHASYLVAFDAAAVDLQGRS